MSILQTITDNVGDFLGTSKLERLNRSVFRPVLGTEITRQEYDMCNGNKLIPIPDQREAMTIKSLKDEEREQLAASVLDLMVENGTIFSDKRIATLVAAGQRSAGSNDVSYKIMRQMSHDSSAELDQALRHQKKMTQIPRL